ncbi:MAG: hypothetical protein NTW86_30970 [Candidatus Sumerlaeota bacterium]|nr:hypothetical protein [Candidatus Sumerlaeota bacterium]
MSNRLSLLSLACALALSVLGCVGGPKISYMGPGGAPGSIFDTHVTYPNDLNANMDYRIVLGSEDIEFLAPITVETTSYNFLFLFSFGDSGYGKLIEMARRELGADGVMNTTVDTKYVGVLGLYRAVTTRLTGEAYCYKRPTGVTRPPKPAGPFEPEYDAHLAKPEVMIKNMSDKTITVEFSGPMKRTLTVGPHETERAQLAEGEYQYEASAPEVEGVSGRSTFTAYHRYTWQFSVESR